jgi:aspartate/methionine/tyrosine aminotransferase
MRPFALERLFARHEFSARRLLSASDPDGLTQKELIAGADPQCRRLWKNLKLGYTESQGHPLLRQEIAKLYETVAPEHILTLTPEEGIYLAMRALIKKGEHMVCTVPAYQSLHEIARDNGAKISPWRPREAHRWSFSLADLERALTPKTKLIVINFPHNPTGAHLSEMQLHAVIAMARRSGAWIFSDEMYRGLEGEGTPQLPSVADLYERSITLSGLSKIYGLAGLRQGWLVVRRPAHLRRLREHKDYTTICSSAPSEILALMGLRQGARLISRHRRRVHKNAQLAADFCQRHEKWFSWRAPQAATVALPRLHHKSGAQAVCERLVTRHGLFLAPSTAFAFGNHHVRFGLGRKDFPTSLKALARALRRF